MQVYTIGHGTRSLEGFIAVLKVYGIKLLVDVRAFPRSRKFPWFGKDILESALRESGIKYLHYPELGGFREGGYEAFIRTKEFSTSIENLLGIIGDKTAVIMCAELLWWRCHRRYIANTLAEGGEKVIHIFDEKRKEEHSLKRKDIGDKMKLRIHCNKSD